MPQLQALPNAVFIAIITMTLRVVKARSPSFSEIERDSFADVVVTGSSKLHSDSPLQATSHPRLILCVQFILFRTFKRDVADNN